MYSAQDIASEVSPSGNTQQDVFSFIVHFFEINTVSPTLTEICQGLEAIQQRPTAKRPLIYYHLKELQRKGKVELVSGHRGGAAARIIVKFSSWKFHGYREVTYRGKLP